MHEPPTRASTALVRDERGRVPIFDPAANAVSAADEVGDRAPARRGLVFASAGDDASAGMISRHCVLGDSGVPPDARYLRASGELSR